MSNTLWNEDEPSKEEAMLKILQSDGVWMDMEENFKAKAMVINMMGQFEVFVHSGI